MEPRVEIVFWVLAFMGLGSFWMAGRGVGFW
jgi:hypothetical protein